MVFCECGFVLSNRSRTFDASASLGLSAVQYFHVVVLNYIIAMYIIDNNKLLTEVCNYRWIQDAKFNVIIVSTTRLIT